MLASRARIKAMLPPIGAIVRELVQRGKPHWPLLLGAFALYLLDSAIGFEIGLTTVILGAFAAACWHLWKKRQS